MGSVQTRGWKSRISGELSAIKINVSKAWKALLTRGFVVVVRLKCIIVAVGKKKRARVNH